MSSAPWSAWSDLRETHSGVVLLMGDRAYKFKKPVDLGFLDYTRPPQREEACRREVRLNRRLAPDVYLGVGRLTGPVDDVVEHVVMMRRMPENRRLSWLVQSGYDVDDAVRDVARRLAVFHADAEPVTDGPKSVTATSLRLLWRSSFYAMAEFTDRIIPASAETEVERLVGQFLDGREDLLERRRLTGAVVDGHGDLLAEDIFCLDDGPRMLDCLDFDDGLRIVDRIDDAAFLAMDLERLGAPDLAERFLGWYAEFSGDEAPRSLIEHYLAYRAFVRAKVACIRHDQGQLGSAVEARALIEQTLTHLRRGAVRLVVVGGSPGTGKSTLAGGLADRLGATLLSSDRIRKELAGLPPLGNAEAPLGQGIYSGAWTRQVHEELMRRAGLLLRLGETVVVDGTWAKEWRRDLARRTARQCSADLVELRCEVPEEVADERVRTRGHQVSAAGSVSDAGVSVTHALRSDFDAWPSALTLDTSVPAEVSLEQALRLIRPEPPRGNPAPASLRGAT